MLVCVLILPSKPQFSKFFCSPFTSYPSETKNPDNSNIIHLFNNNTHTGFRTTSKLLSSLSRYLSDLTELKYHKTKH